MIPYTLKFNYIGEWARQQGLFKLRVTGVAYGFRGLSIYLYWDYVSDVHV